jgi:hypothetical protein
LIIQLYASNAQILHDFSQEFHLFNQTINQALKASQAHVGSITSTFFTASTLISSFLSIIFTHSFQSVIRIFSSLFFNSFSIIQVFSKSREYS